MNTDRMQASYRAIFVELFKAQAAAAVVSMDVGARCADLIRQECQVTLAALVEKTRPDSVKDASKDPGEYAGVGPLQPDGGFGTTGVSRPLSANFCRALAGLPRLSMVSFLSQYDDLRGRRPAVRD